MVDLLLESHLYQCVHDLPTPCSGVWIEKSNSNPINEMQTNPILLQKSKKCKSCQKNNNWASFGYLTKNNNLICSTFKNKKNKLKNHQETLVKWQQPHSDLSSEAPHSSLYAAFLSMVPWQFESCTVHCDKRLEWWFRCSSRIRGQKTWHPHTEQTHSHQLNMENRQSTVPFNNSLYHCENFVFLQNGIQ